MSMPFQTYYNVDTNSIVMTTDPLMTSPEFISSRSPTIQTPHLEDSDTLYDYSSESPHLSGDYNFLQSPQEQFYFTTNMPLSTTKEEDVSFYDFSKNTTYSTPHIETVPIPHFNGDPKLLVIDKSKITELKPNYDYYHHHHHQNVQDFIAKPEEEDQDIKNQKLLNQDNNNNIPAAESFAENEVHLFPPLLSAPGCSQKIQMSEAAVDKALYGSDSPLSELADDDDMNSQMSYDEYEEEEEEQEEQAEQVKQEYVSDNEYQEEDDEQVQENNDVDDDDTNEEEEEYRIKEESPSRKRRADSSSDSDNEDYDPEPRKKKRRQYKKKTTVTKKKKNTGATKKKSTGTTTKQKNAAVDERPYKCPHCDHASKRRYNLSTHIKTHDKDRIKDFPCDLCDKGFDRKHDRDRHVATVHMGERSHVCHLCKAHFSRGDALNRHMVQRHDYEDDNLY